MLKPVALALFSLLFCSCTSELSVSFDDKVDGAYYDAQCDKNYYVTDGAQKVYVGTYHEAPVLYQFDFADVLVCGNKSTEVHLVTRENGEIKLTYIIPQVYDLHPESRPFVLFADEVYQVPSGDIAIRFYSPSEDITLVIHVDRKLTLRLERQGQ